MPDWEIHTFSEEHIEPLIISNIVKAEYFEKIGDMPGGINAGIYLKFANGKELNWCRNLNFYFWKDRFYTNFFIVKAAFFSRFYIFTQLGNFCIISVKQARIFEKIRDLNPRPSRQLLRKH